MYILDSTGDGLKFKFIVTLLKLFCIEVKEINFVIGNMKTLEGTAIPLAARKMAGELALQAARSVVSDSELIRHVNDEWERNTLLLHLAKKWWLPVEHMLARIMVTGFFAGKQGNIVLFLEKKAPIDYIALTQIAPNVDLKFYSSWGLLNIVRYYPLIMWLWDNACLFFRRIYGKQEAPCGFSRCQSLLLLQEDLIHPDRSKRTQPHWFFEEDGMPSFQTLILESGDYTASCDMKELNQHDINIVNVCVMRHLPDLPVQRQLQKAMWRSALLATYLSGDESSAHACFFKLFRRSYMLASFCKIHNVRVFMSCENYMSDVDAMQLIAPSLNIRTLSYQYSNMPYVLPAMMTTADVMMTFSDLYQSGWCTEDIRPKSFVNIGYLYDSSFPLVRERAASLRQKIEGAGSSFVICYFDENTSDDKYKLMHHKEHMAEIEMLARLTLEDPSLAIIIKVQFCNNSPRKLCPQNKLIAKAIATGRFIECMEGVHRNILFPAELAMVSDMTIGNAVGATASLEAALAGTRSILLNRFGMPEVSIDIFSKGDIIYPQLQDALSAISEYREGVRAHQSLGDWSLILHYFDPFRDGRSARRMREVIDKAMGSPIGKG